MAGLSRALLLLTTLVLVLDLSLSQVLGGLEEADMEDKDTQEALDFAVNKYNEMKNDRYLSRVVEVLQAKKQTVAGMNYWFKVELARTTCTKSQADVTNCPFNEQPDQQQSEICFFELSVVPWMQEKTLTNVKCQSA